MDDHIKSGNQRPDSLKLRLENGKICFTRETERKFYFILTIIMLALGACFKLGALQ
jgi:hypothetical protein